MNLKNIKKLVSGSYAGNKLDEKKVSLIAKNLSRLDLKRYIKHIKISQSKMSVIIYVSDMSAKPQVISRISKLFPDKQVTIYEDKDLIGGIKIIDYDMVYENSIKNTLNNMVSNITN